MFRFAISVFLAWVLVALLSAPTASAMNKAELIDAVASSSGLSKADSKRAVDTVLDTIGRALKKGDKIALVGFGTFSPVGPIRSKDAGDDADYESSWARSAKGDRIGGGDCDDYADPGPPPVFDPESGYLIEVDPSLLLENMAFEVQDIREENGLVWVFGPYDGRTRFSVGDTVHLAAISKVLASKGLAETRVGASPVLTATVVDVRFLRGPGNGNRGGENVGLLLRGIEKKDIRRGMVVAKPPVADPNVYCGIVLVGEGLIRALAAACPDCTSKEYTDEWATILRAFGNAIIHANAAGAAVEIEGFGAFYVLRETLLSDFAPDSGFAPAQTKNVVRFKAGAELSGKVN